MTREHWETVYLNRDTDTLGWYEETPAPCLQLIARCGLDKAAPILDVGAGATTLIDHLLDLGYERVAALDISGAALDKLQLRLGPERAARVEWIVDDITQPEVLLSHEPVVLWHDRALLHFLRGESEQQAYAAALRTLVAPGGFVIIGVFSTQGAERCSGLELKRYDEADLAEFLGRDFALEHSFRHVYTMPSGDPRPYVYTLFRRIRD